MIRIIVMDRLFRFLFIYLFIFVYVMILFFFFIPYSLVVCFVRFDFSLVAFAVGMDRMPYASAFPHIDIFLGHVCHFYFYFHSTRLSSFSHFFLADCPLSTVALNENMYISGNSAYDGFTASHL